MEKMLKEVALKEICGNDDMNEVKIESFSSGSIDCASEELDNIIRNSIGIQVSLADILIGKKRMTKAVMILYLLFH